MNVNLAARSGGLLVGGAFGLAFVLANAHSPLGGTASLTLRLLGAGCFVAVIASAIRATQSQRSRNAAPRDPQRPSWYGRQFLWVVIGEVALLEAGLQLL